MRPLMSIDTQTMVRALTPEGPQEYSPALTSSEMANLWTPYLNASIDVRRIAHALNIRQDGIPNHPALSDAVDLEALANRQ